MQRIFLTTMLIFASVALTACPDTLRNEIGKMTVVTPPADLVSTVRKWVNENANFKCPPGSKYAYGLFEVNLETNETNAGIRCD